MTQATDMANAEMAKLSEKAAHMLLSAAAKVTDDDHKRAHRVLAELFNEAPWLATSEINVGGCLNVRYCDLFAMVSDYLENA